MSLLMMQNLLEVAVHALEAAYWLTKLVLLGVEVLVK